MGRAAEDTSDAGTGGDGTALADALKAIAAGYDRATTDGERRAFGQRQLEEITLHLQREGVPGDALRPVTALMHGLADLDRGCAPPILQARRKAGSPPIPCDELRQRGLAAAAVTLLMRAEEAQGYGDQALDRAVLKVAHRIRGWRAAQRRRAVRGGRQSLPEAVKDWRERAMRGGGAEADWDARIYAQVVQLADNGAPPAELADWVLAEGYEPYR